MCMCTKLGVSTYLGVKSPATHKTLEIKDKFSENHIKTDQHGWHLFSKSPPIGQPSFLGLWLTPLRISQKSAQSFKMGGGNYTVPINKKIPGRRYFLYDTHTKEHFGLQKPTHTSTIEQCHKEVLTWLKLQVLRNISHQTFKKLFSKTDPWRIIFMENKHFA